jgi:hypothetical protein
VREFRFKEGDYNPNSYIDDPIFNSMHSPKDVEFMNHSLSKLNKIQETLDKASGSMVYYLLNKDKVDKLRQKVDDMSTMNPDILDHWNKVSGPLRGFRRVPGTIQNIPDFHHKDDRFKEEEEDSDLGELNKYKKFVDNDYKAVKDFRSDYDKHKDTYYDPNGKKLQDYPHYKFFKTEGDGSTISLVLKAINSNNPIAQIVQRIFPKRLLQSEKQRRGIQQKSEVIRRWLQQF